MIVVDVNILAFYLLEGDRTPAAHALHQSDPEWIVPPFWAVEFQSILWKYIRLRNLPLEQALSLQDRAAALFKPGEKVPPPALVLREAVRFGISVYDAQYIALADYNGLVCVTEDAGLRRQCPGLAVSIESRLSGGDSLRESSAPYGRSAVLAPVKRGKAAKRR